MTSISNEVQAMAKIVIAKAALFGLYEEYATKKQFNMDRMTSVEKNLDDALALLHGKSNTKTYPHPCGEILLGGTMEEYSSIQDQHRRGAAILYRATRPDND